MNSHSRPPKRNETPRTVARKPWWSSWPIKILSVCVLAIGLPAVLAEVFSSGSAGIASAHSALAWVNAGDAERTLKVYKVETGKTVNMPWNDYIVDVMAAQMPPTAPQAALEAMAVLVRTYVYRSVALPPSFRSSLAQSHGANVSDNGQADLAWWTSAFQEIKYGSAAPTDEALLRGAVLATDGMVLTYHQQPILPFFTEMSSGRTANDLYSLGRQLPYLPSLLCPADVYAATWQAAGNYSAAQLANKLGISPSALDLPSLHITGYGEGGYPISVADGAVQWTATDFVSRLGLPSADFRFTIHNGTISIRTKGNGGGLGLSIHEAQAMAQKGATMPEILSHFFPGTAREVIVGGGLSLKPLK